jgi:hypothetical protein
MPDQSSSFLTHISAMLLAGALISVTLELAMKNVI